MYHSPTVMIFISNITPDNGYWALNVVLLGVKWHTLYWRMKKRTGLRDYFILAVVLFPRISIGLAFLPVSSGLDWDDGGDDDDNDDGDNDGESKFHG